MNGDANNSRLETIQEDTALTTVRGNDKDSDPHAGGEPISALQAAWNVTNAIQGMFIVGLPIAVKVGGWYSILAMIAVAYICYWTGVLLIECLYDNKGEKVRYSYREVAEFYRPGFGKWVLAAQLTELLSTCIIYVVLAADLMQGCFPSIDKAAWMMLVSAVLMPCAFLDSLILVSQLSFANAISHLIVNAIMLIYCLSQQEISNSLPNQGFKTLVNLVLVTKALLSYPLPFYAAVQLFKDNLFRGAPVTPFTGCYSPDGSLREWALLLRIILLLFTLFIALSVPYLIEVMGMVGNITGTMLSFIWPALFHLKIKGDKMVDRDRKFDQFIIGLGCAICICGVYFSFLELLRAMNSADQ
ncbi:hypothetical protein WR25_25618 [Diploscapter pachys]|uniref:Amino acid transporter transmembrane domain-containing protein n=1 Tax=Diploscapter pachys TaxID=2018661 RepID=A0A2A2LLC6_9BILA|nr:hypothetical protein WR25_25618 [Diploscapter pachys]